jgi:hypothetical protein
MAILKISDSFCNDRIGVKCFDLLFDAYGTPEVITTGEDMMNGISRLRLNIVGVEKDDEVDIRFTEKYNGVVEMSPPVLILKEDGDNYKPFYLSGK